MFDLARNSLMIRKQQTESFIIIFKPQWICEETGLLTLKNEVTKEEYEYELKGIGEEPLAEDHIILNCKARETTKASFDVKNYSDK